MIINFGVIITVSLIGATLIRRLRQEQATTEAANRELEKRVQERAFELSQAKDQLEMRVKERTREFAHHAEKSMSR